MRLLSVSLAAALALSLAACGVDHGRPPGVIKMTPPPEKPRPTAADALRNLAPQGISTTRLFDEKLDGADARLDRLEHAVQGVRDDLDVLAPALIKTAEKPVVVAPAPVVQTAKGDVTGFRFADHADKTRVVLDMTADCACVPALSEDGKTLSIPLQQMNWQGKAAWDAESAKLVSGYRYSAGVLQVSLMYVSKMTTAEVLKPSTDSKAYRLVVDLVSADIPK